jgi:glycosyltransferase involved in cell wall biosynthesis
VAIVVQGRFHAFDLARALARRGDEVVVFTNYPAWAAGRFHVEPATIRSAWVHGVMARALPHMPGDAARKEAWGHEAFGRWAARALEGRRWDVIHCWSGVSEELLLSDRLDAGCRLLMRGSAHIAVQDRLLAEEEARTGLRMERPSAWMIAREEREYRLADAVVVLSTFARDTFEAEGHPTDRLRLLPLGVDVEAFRPPAHVIAARDRRIRSGAPLRVLYAGALSLRKGMWDLAAALAAIHELPLDVRLAGSPMAEAASVMARMGPRVRGLGPVPQRDLPAVYWDADVFVFPTIEDGFGVVLSQAMAAGLPVICTSHSAGPDLIHDGVDGWVVPVRSPQTLADRLTWCHTHREALCGMAAVATSTRASRDWTNVAEDFDAIADDCAPAPASEGALA